jgi:hypothetical protein
LLLLLVLLLLLPLLVLVLPAFVFVAAVFELEDVLLSAPLLQLVLVVVSVFELLSVELRSLLGDFPSLSANNSRVYHAANHVV